MAERLWGEHGLNGVSLRQISTDSGLSNPSSVHYHFGGRDELITAIFAHRLPAIDQRRQELLSALQLPGKRKADLRALLDCLFRPLLEQVDDEGRHSYAALLRQILQFEPTRAARASFMHLTPATAELMTLIRDAVATLPPVLYNQRMLAANFMMLDVLIQLDNGELPLPGEVIFADALDMLTAGITLPASPVVTQKLLSKGAGV